MTPGRSVVHVVRSDGFAGVERYIADVAAILDARGWGVTVIGGDEASMRRELPAGVSYRPARTTADVARRLLSVGRHDVVHAHMTAAELPAALLKPMTARRLVTTRHFAGTRGSSAPARMAARLIAKSLDAQIAISSFVASRVEGECFVLPNAVRDATLPAVPRARTVVMVQRLEQEKDTATAIDAWHRSGLADAGWRLVIHGRGSQEPQLRQLVGHLGLGSSVELAGFTPDPRSVMRAAGIFLATAPEEPFGLSVVEAMAEATPVVAARGGAHQETVGDDRLLFAPRDADACADLLRRLADDPEERAETGARLQARQRRLFALDGHVDGLEAVYSS